MPSSHPDTSTATAVKVTPTMPSPWVPPQDTVMWSSSRPAPRAFTAQPPDVQVTREFRMVTLAAVTVRQPWMSQPSRVAPAVVMLRSPDCVRIGTQFEGTPVLVASGNPHADGLGRQLVVCAGGVVGGTVVGGTVVGGGVVGTTVGLGVTGGVVAAGGVVVGVTWGCSRTRIRCWSV